jgi:hypothetical protein
MSNDESRPLDALLMELPQVPDDVPIEPVHARVLEVGTDGELSYLISVYSDPGTPLALHQALRKRIEGTLLAELCRTPAQLREASPAPSAIHLVAYALPAGDVEAALAAFAFRPIDPTHVRMRESAARSRGEAYALELTIPDEPVATYVADIARTPSPELARVELGLVDALADGYWGEKPGAYAAQLTRFCALVGLGTFDANLDGLVALEGAITSREPGHVRMITPAIFQGLCDFIGVVATNALRLKVDFADCALDEEGFAPPPLLRVHTKKGHVHVPIALDLLRWLVMPLAPGETPPSLADWLTDRLGGV